MPFHKERAGYLFKHEDDYRKWERRVRTVSAGECAKYVCTKRVKLSLHFDGFMQFSGLNSSKITSGPDDVAKGTAIGVKSCYPIDIASGPVAGMQAWGLDQFDVIGEKKVYELFTADAIWIKRMPEEDVDAPVNREAYSIEIFMFRRSSYWHLVRSCSGRLTMKVRLPYFSKIIFRHELRVIDLPGQEFFLGVTVSQSRPMKNSEFRFRSTSGYILNGPSLVVEKDPEVLETIGAVFPPPFEAPDAVSIDRDIPSE